MTDTEPLYRAVVKLNPTTKKNSLEIRYKAGSGKGVVYKIVNGTLKRMGVPFIGQGKRYTTYEQAAGWYLKRPKQPINERVNVQCIFYRENAIRCDLSNLTEAIDDILVKYGILADDNFKIVAGHDGSRVYVDRDHPRTEIIITRLVE